MKKRRRTMHQLLSSSLLRLLLLLLLLSVVIAVAAKEHGIATPAGFCFHRRNHYWPSASSASTAGASATRRGWTSSSSSSSSRKRTFSRRSAADSRPSKDNDNADFVDLTRSEEVAEEVGPLNNKSKSNRRRSLLLSLPTAIFLQTPPKVANAGLVQFPCDELFNTYHLMRAGLSMYEEQDMWSTNPLFLTNRDDALSAKGQEQVRKSCQQLKSIQNLPTIVSYSLAAACIDTANIVGRELNIGRDRIVPEFSYLDPRAVGKWDMLSKAETQPAVWAMDNDEAGEAGQNPASRPPPNDDGTPHETLSEQAVRLRQYFSLLESKSSGETVLLIFPDGTGPALLSAMIAGIPYNRVHELEYESGEIRLDVTKESTLKLWESKQQLNGKEWDATLDEGRKTLARLRESPESIVSKRDQQIEEERIAIDTEYTQQQEEKQRIIDEKEKQSREKRQREIAEAKAEKERQSKLELEERRQKQQQRETAAAALQRNKSRNTVVDFGLASIAVAAVGGTAVALNDPPPPPPPPKERQEREPPPTKDSDLDLVDDSSPMEIIGGGDEDGSSDAEQPIAASATTTATASAGSLYDNRVNGSDSNIQKTTTTSSSSKSLFDDEIVPVLPSSSKPVVVEVDPYEAAEKAMQEYLDRDDGSEDWLQSIAEIARADDDDQEEQLQDE